MASVGLLCVRKALDLTLPIFGPLRVVGVYRKNEYTLAQHVEMLQRQKEEGVTSGMADYAAIQVSKQLQASLPASEPVSALVKVAPALDCKITPIEDDYTLTDHIAQLKAREDEQTEPTKHEQAIMNRLKSDGLFLGKRCDCGCRLRRHMAGGIYTVCARCEPGGLWSYQTLKMLNR